MYQNVGFRGEKSFTICFKICGAAAAQAAQLRRRAGPQKMICLESSDSATATDSALPESLPRCNSEALKLQVASLRDSETAGEHDSDAAGSDVAAVTVTPSRTPGLPESAD